MYATLKKLQKYKFPLYRIPSNNWDIIDNIIFVDGAPVDDLNMKGNSIGLRRLQSGRSDYIQLKKPLFLVGDLIKDKGLHYISSDGKPFTYEKVGFQHLRYHEIKKIEPRNTFTFVWLKDFTIPFEIPRPPADPDRCVWARVLYYGEFPWMIYEFSFYKGKNSRIRV